VKPGEHNADLERALYALEVREPGATEYNSAWLYFPADMEPLSSFEAAGSGPEKEGEDDDEVMKEG